MRTGQLAIQLAYDIVLLKVNDRVQVYPAHAVESVHFYDERENINRKFLSLAQPDQYARPALYEVVVRGEVAVLRRAKDYINTRVSEQDAFDFFLWHDASLIPLNRFRDKIYPMMLARHQTAMTTYKTERDINPNNPADAIRLIKFYNELVHIEKTSWAVR